MVHEGSHVEGREGFKGHQLAQGGTWDSDTLKMTPGAQTTAAVQMQRVQEGTRLDFTPETYWREAQSFLPPSQEPRAWGSTIQRPALQTL